MNGFDPKQHEAEARERWGHTNAYRESTERAASHTPADWARIKEETERIEEGFAALLRAGVPADGAEAMALAEEARLQIHRWFYPCSHAMHAGLAEMYTADARFAAHYDQREAGLSGYVAEAIRANGARHPGR